MTKNKIDMEIGYRVILVICILFFLVQSGCIESENNEDGEDFSFISLDNNVKYLRDYRGKVVILDMWATTCPPCAYQMIELQKTYDHYGSDDLEILSIDVGQETPSVIQQYRETFQNTYGISFDWVFGMDNGTIWSRYDISGGIPTLYVFDQEGKAYFSHVGLCIFDETPSGYPDGLTRLRPILDELLG